MMLLTKVLNTTIKTQGVCGETVFFSFFFSFINAFASQNSTNTINSENVLGTETRWQRPDETFFSLHFWWFFGTIYEHCIRFTFIKTGLIETEFIQTDILIETKLEIECNEFKENRSKKSWRLDVTRFSFWPR